MVVLRRHGGIGRFLWSGGPYVLLAGAVSFELTGIHLMLEATTKK